MIMPEEILINTTLQEVRIALLENNVLQELYIERLKKLGITGNIYKGKVSRLLPGIQAAFVDIGLERAGFLHVSDVGSGTHADIRDVITVGSDVLVQVYKDPIGSKGARLTTQITLPARYLVLTPRIFQVTVSQKIASEAERNRLMALTTPGEEGGYIFRTAAEGVAADEIETDKLFLTKLWKEIQAQIQKTKPGRVVYEEIPLPLRILRDLANHQVTRIRVDDESVWHMMRGFAKNYVPHLENIIEYYAEKRPIFDIFSIESEIQKLLERKVHLKSGGYLVFDQTEAMTTIDVNTGSYTGHSDLEQTIYKINLEAVDSIARQVKLRNLGGIIIVDFIDMENPAHKTHLLACLNEALAKDNVRIEVSEISNLGLVQMTRKRTRESLENILCVTCPLCSHRGTIKSYETIAYEILREIKRTAYLFNWDGFLVIATEGMINYLFETQSTAMAQLESQLGKAIKLRAEGSYRQEQYDVLPLS